LLVAIFTVVETHSIVHIVAVNVSVIIKLYRGYGYADL
jgi:hypothetical protein